VASASGVTAQNKWTTFHPMVGDSGSGMPTRVAAV
jgi:hypothetical protein